jgi:hypothetical protein
LLNRFWVLTARHCVANFPLNGSGCRPIDAPLATPESVTITAAWAPGRVAIPTRLRDFRVNTPVPTCRDIILIYLGAADLGEVNLQPIYAVSRPGPGNGVVLSGSLTSSDTVTQYGQGFGTFATDAGPGGWPPAQPSGGLGVYRSARFTPTNFVYDTSRIMTHYDLLMNPSNEVGHGGDSGGPTWVTVSDVGIGIAGVQSSCWATGFVTGAPNTWQWATGISGCHYVSTEPFIGEILAAIKEAPECSSMEPKCGLPAILDVVLRH